MVWEDIDGISNARAVQILYGGPLALGSADNQLWRENSPDMVDSAEEEDNFGTVMVIDDFETGDTPAWSLTVP